MNKIFLGAIALSALGLSASANAADLAARYNKAPPVLASPAYDWSGFYIGVNAGYTFSDRNDVTTAGQVPANMATVTAGLRNPLVNFSRDGFIGGGQFGYNWQVSPNWVFGLEADIQYVDNRTTLAAFGTSGLSNTFRGGLDYLGTARGRVGYVWGPAMLYATGGLAYGGVQNGASFNNAAGALAFFGQDTSIRTGYTVGGGIEYLVTQNWSVKAEYLYYDLGRSTTAINLVAPGLGVGTGYNVSFRNDGHIARAGLNYKFGGPVVARY